METQNLSFHGNRGAPHPQRGPRRNGAGASPTRRVPQDGHVRRLGPGAPTQARATHWGCVSRWLPALPAPGRALRSAGAVASGLRLNSSPRPEEARLSLRGSLPWVGLGTGRRAGVGEASRAAAGETAAGKISTAARFGRKKGKLRRRGGRGEKPGSGRRKRQGERDLARCTNSREMAPESRGPRRPLSRPRLRRGG